MAAFISFTSFLSLVHFSASALAPALPVIFCSSFRMYALACFVSALCCFSSTLGVVRWVEVRVGGDWWGLIGGNEGIGGVEAVGRSLAARLMATVVVVVVGVQAPSSPHAFERPPGIIRVARAALRQLPQRLELAGLRGVRAAQPLRLPPQICPRATEVGGGRPMWTEGIDVAGDTEWGRRGRAGVRRCDAGEKE